MAESVEHTAELLAALSDVECGKRIEALDREGALTAAIPELEPARSCAQNAFHHLPVLAHTFEALGFLDELIADPSGASERYADRIARSLETAIAGVGSLDILRLSMLLHDVSKPATRVEREDGKITFYGHDIEGARVSREVALRLSFGVEAADAVSLLVRHHLRLGFITRDDPPGEKSIARFIRHLCQLVPHEVLLSLADRRATRGTQVCEENVRRHLLVAEEILGLYFEPPEKPAKPLLTGEEVMRIAGIGESPRVGELLRMLAEEEESGRMRTKEEAEEWLKKLFFEG